MREEAIGTICFAIAPVYSRLAVKFDYSERFDIDRDRWRAKGASALYKYAKDFCVACVSWTARAKADRSAEQNTTPRKNAYRKVGRLWKRERNLSNNRYFEELVFILNVERRNNENTANSVSFSGIIARGIIEKRETRTPVRAKKFSVLAETSSTPINAVPFTRFHSRTIRHSWCTMVCFHRDIISYIARRKDELLRFHTPRPRYTHASHFVPRALNFPESGRMEPARASLSLLVEARKDPISGSRAASSQPQELIISSCILSRRVIFLSSLCCSRLCFLPRCTAREKVYCYKSGLLKIRSGPLKQNLPIVNREWMYALHFDTNTSER